MSRTIATIFYVIFGAIGGLVLPIGALMLLSIFLSWLHDDPAAGGVLSFLVVPIAPLGFMGGIALGIMRVNQLYDTKKQ